MTGRVISRCGFIWAALAIVVTRGVVGVLLVEGLPPVSVDDYFRVFYAAWWWEHPGFTSSYVWLPGYLYLYGPVVGVFQDMVTAPRLLSLMLHLITGSLFLALPGVSRFGRLLACGLFLFMPLSLVMGQLALSEVGAGLFMVGHLVCLVSFRRTRLSGWLLASAVGLLGAAMFRYEIWGLIPVFIWQGTRQKCDDVSASVQRMVVGVPLIFPIVWTVFCGISQGRWFRYAWATSEDHFGAGDLSGVYSSVIGAVSLGLVLWVVGSAIGEVCRRRGRVTRLFVVYAMVLIVPVLAVIITSSMPSQYPLRVFYLSGIVAVVPVSLSLERFSTIGRRGVMVVGLLLFVWGGGEVFRTPMGIAPYNYRAAKWVDHLYRSGELGEDDHVLISRFMPDNTAVYVLANRMDRVHLDAMGARCKVQFLLPFEPSCPLPSWGDKVQVALVWRGTMEHQYVMTLGWRKMIEIGPWVAFRRFENSVFPVERVAPMPAFL